MKNKITLLFFTVFNILVVAQENGTQKLCIKEKTDKVYQLNGDFCRKYIMNDKREIWIDALEIHNVGDSLRLVVDKRKYDEYLKNYYKNLKVK